MIKEIIFDLGGVYFESRTKESKNEFFHQFSVSQLIIDEIFENYPLKEGYKYRIGKISKENFWRAAKRKLQITEEQIPVIQEIWHGSYKPNRRLKELIKILRKRYRVVAFSGNIKERIEYLENKYEFKKDFDALVLSYQEGFSKTDIDFYKLLTQKSKCEPSEAIYIDDKKEFVDLGKTVGLNGIVFENIEQLVKDLKVLGIEIPQ